MTKKIMYVAGCVLAGMLAQPMAAQDMNRWTFHAGGGFTEPVRWSGSRFDTGFNLAAGAGINLTRRFGIEGQFAYNDLGLSTAALNAAEVPSGSGRIYSITATPIVRLNPRGRFDAYALAGGGFYRRTIEFTEPTTATVTGFDPFYGYFPAVIPVNQVLGSFTQNKGGVTVGAGLTYAVHPDSNAKFFAETRYHYIFTTPVRTTMLPVTFGFRW